MTKAFTLMPWPASLHYRLHQWNRFACLAFLHQPSVALGSSHQLACLAVSAFATAGGSTTEIH